jgi:hypothetical protein
MKLIHALFIIVSVAFAAPVKLSIAVSDLETRGLTKDDAGIISDRLRDELLNTGAFRVMERSVMDEILKEQSLQASGACSGSDCQVQIGRLLGVDRIVVGSIGKLGTLYSLTVRLLNVETGEVELSFSEDHQGAIEDLVRGPIRSVAMHLAGIAPPKPNPIATAVPTPATPSGAPRLVAANDPTAPAPVTLSTEPGEAKTSLRAEKRRRILVEPTPTPAPSPVATTTPATKPPSADALPVFEFGIRSGYGGASIAGDSATESRLQEGSGFWQIGGAIRINLGVISLAPEVLYTRRSLEGSIRSSNNLFFWETQTTVTANYISIPFLVAVNFTPHLFAFAGPTGDIFLSSEIKSSTSLTASSSGIKKDTSDTDNSSTGMNFAYPSLVMGAGARLGSSFLVDFRLQKPFADAYNNEEDPTYRRHSRYTNWSLMLGYLF